MPPGGPGRSGEGMPPPSRIEARETPPRPASRLLWVIAHKRRKRPHNTPCEALSARLRPVEAAPWETCAEWANTPPSQRKPIRF